MTRAKKITRIAVVSLTAVALLAIAGVTAATVGVDGVFSDVPDSHEYADEINAAQAVGLVHGIGGGLYDPERTLTSTQADKLVERLLDHFTDDNDEFTLSRAEAAALLITGLCGLHPETTGCHHVATPRPAETDDDSTDNDETTDDDSTTDGDDDSTDEESDDDETTDDDSSGGTSDNIADGPKGDWRTYTEQDPVTSQNIVGWYLVSDDTDGMPNISHRIDMRCLGNELQVYANTLIWTDRTDSLDVSYLAASGDTRISEKWSLVQGRHNENFVFAPNPREFIGYLTSSTGSFRHRDRLPPAEPRPSDRTRQLGRHRRHSRGGP